MRLSHALIEDWVVFLFSLLLPGFVPPICGTTHGVVWTAFRSKRLLKPSWAVVADRIYGCNEFGTAAENPRVTRL